MTAQPGTGNESDLQQRFEVYKLEYQIAADRYDNIYKAIWQNFSYMAILAGGILTFGTRTLSMYWAGFLSLMPLLFWFIATYLPMDHYARGARKRAADIEKILTSDFLKLNIPEDGPIEDATRQIRHFRDFGLEDPTFHWGKAGKWRYKGFPPHVNQVVVPVGILLCVAAAVLFVAGLTASRPASQPQRVVITSESGPIPVQATMSTSDSLRADLARAMIKLDRMDTQAVKTDSVLRAILRCVRKTPRVKC